MPKSRNKKNAATTPQHSLTPTEEMLGVYARTLGRHHNFLQELYEQLAAFPPPPIQETDSASDSAPQPDSS